MKKLSKAIFRGIFYTVFALVLVLLGLIITSYLLKDRLINTTLEVLNQNLKAKIEVDPDIEVSIFERFPSISLVFKNVRVHEPSDMGKQMLGKAKEFSLSFDFYKIIHAQYVIEQIAIKEGQLDIKIDSMGRPNYQIIELDTQPKRKSIDFELEKIKLFNMELSYRNFISKQEYQTYVKNAQLYLEYKANQYLLNLDAETLIKSIRIDQAEYFKNKKVELESNLSIDLNKGNIYFQETKLEVEQAGIELTGTLNYNKPRFIDLKLKEKGGDIQKLISLLPTQYTQGLSDYKSEGDVYMTAYIKGEFANNKNPLVEVNFGFKNARFFNPQLKSYMNEVNMIGYFTNGHKRKTHTAVLRLDKFACKIGNNPVKGELTISNFNSPYLKCALSGKIDAQSLLGFYPVSTVKSAKGIISIDAKFKGRLEDFKKHNSSQHIDAQGEISIQQLDIELQKLSAPIQQLNAELLFNNNDLSVSHLSLRYGESDFEFSGLVKNGIKRLFAQAPVYLEGEVMSNNLNFDEIKKSLATVSLTNTSSKAKENEIIATPTSVSDMIKLSVSVKYMQYRKLKLRQFKTDFTYTPKHLYLSSLICKGLGGKLSADAHLSQLTNKRTEIRLIGNYENINIDSLFYVSDDFGQDFITQKNIKGETSGNIDALFDINKHNDIVFKTAVAQIDAKITNGELKHFEPLQRLSSFIDEKKLEHIQFSELNNKIFIDSGEVHIPEMEIKSNVSELSISGIHSFDQKIDYRLALSLRSLSKAKKDSDEAFGAIAPDHRGKPTLFLTIKGTTDNYKLSYDKQRTQQKIKQDLKKEKVELMEVLKIKDKTKIEPSTNKVPESQQYFDFD